MAPEEMRADYPDIPLSHFYAAIAYYLSNKAVVDAAIRAEEREAQVLHEQHLAAKRQAG